MATCVCDGEQCVCEAIKVLPKLPFWKKHDRPVHGFVAWTAVANAAMIAWLPIAMYAQAPSHDIDVSSPAVVSGVDSCMRQCEAEKSRCALEAAASAQEENGKKCKERAKECYFTCEVVPQLGVTQNKNADLEIPKKSEKARQRQGMQSASSSSEREEEKRDEQKRFAEAKRRISEFSRNLQSIRRKIGQLEKNGMTPPEGLKEALMAGERAVSTLRAAATFEEGAEAQKTIEEVAQIVKGQLGNLESQRKAPQKFSALERQMRQFDRQIFSAKRMADENAERSARFSSVEGALGELKEAYRQAHDRIVSGDVEKGYEVLESEIPGLVRAYKEALKAFYGSGQ